MAVVEPFRTTYALLERGARLLGMQRLDAGLRYPAGLARWPAVLLLAITVWFELVLSGSYTPHAVALLMFSYTVLTLSGMLAFGPIGWLRNAELLEVYLGWFGRLGVIGRRAASGVLCAGCGEGCDPARCMDCPECSVAAEADELRLELRPWFTGLTEVRRAGWSDAAFIVLALAAVSYDGLKETAAWAGPLRLLFGFFQPILESGVFVYYAIDTIGLLLLAAAFFAIFTGGVALARALSGRGNAPTLGTAAGTFAATILPIAGGYLLAHYLTLVILGGVWLPRLLADLTLSQPITLVAPQLDWIPISFVWYLSVGAIVLGHIVAVVLAHRIAMRDAPDTAVRAGLPLVALMVGYTVLSLWIIAQPIVIEPGVPPVGA